MLTVRSDPHRRSGGYALLGGEGLDGLDGIGLEDCQSGLFLGSDGKWSKVRTLLPVSASQDGEVSLGPEIVDFVPTDTRVTVYDPRGNYLGTLFWSDILPSRQDRRKDLDVPTNEPRPITVPTVPDNEEHVRQERLAREQAEKDQNDRTKKESAERERADRERLEKERAERERQARQKEDERQRQEQIARDRELDEQRRQKQEPVLTQAEPLPPLPLFVWKTCFRVFRERPSLLVPCLIAPCFVTYLIRQVDLSWQRQLPDWIFVIAGWLSATEWFSAAMYLYHAFVLALVACLIAKICQLAAMRWTYVVPLVNRESEAAPPTLGPIGFFRMIVISAPTLLACGLATTLDNPLIGPSSYLLSMSLAVAAPLPSMLPASLLENRSIPGAFGRARILQNGVSIATMMTAWVPVVLFVAILIVIIGTSANGFAYELALCLLPCVLPFSGVVNTVLFAELRRRHELREAAAASARVERHEPALGGGRP